MPVYDRSYRRYQARAPLRSVRFWPITREALRLILARRAFLLLLMGAWLPFLGHAAFIYGVTQFPDVGRVAPIDGRLFLQLFEFQKYAVIVVTIFAGAGLVSTDLRTGAILVYLSRPLTRRDYVVGKLCVLLALNLSVTLGPGLMLYAVGAGLAPDQLLKPELAWLAPGAALHAVLLSVVYSLVGLAISALSRSARVAGLAFFALISGLELTRLVLSVAFEVPAAALLSLQADLRLVGQALLGVAPSAREVGLWAAALLLAAVCAGSLVVIRGRVRAVEVVR